MWLRFVEGTTSTVFNRFRYKFESGWRKWFFITQRNPSSSFFDFGLLWSQIHFWSILIDQFWLRFVEGTTSTVFHRFRHKFESGWRKLFFITQRNPRSFFSHFGLLPVPDPPPANLGFCWIRTQIACVSMLETIRGATIRWKTFFLKVLYLCLSENRCE